MARALVYPGQGSQAVGMGKALAEAFPVARTLFDEVDAALDQRLSRLVFDGPEDQLTLTENAQPALMAVGLAATRVLTAESGRSVAQLADVVAGHSLGEYTALAAAGSLTVADAARLLRRRGQAMQQAVPVGEGAMAALLGLDLDVVDGVVAEVAGEGVCAIANDNSPGQVVVSGAAAAVNHAVELAKTRGARRAVLLSVSAPFHCPLMAPAAAVMAEALAEVDLQPPHVPLIANVTAGAVSTPAEISELLVAQVTERVRWRECVLTMRDRGVDMLVELGAGKVLSGLARRIDSGLSAMSVGTPEDVAAFLDESQLTN